jgi:hypothetical protein
MSKDTIKISSIGVRHETWTFSSKMFVYEASNHYHLQLEKDMFITKRGSSIEFIYFSARL